MIVVGRQHALIKKCALNNEVRLITRVYGIMHVRQDAWSLQKNHAGMNILVMYS